VAAINATLPSLLDLARRTDPNGAIAAIVEQLQQTNSVLQDAVWKEGNLPTGEVITARTALPSVGSGLAWRRMNEGITPGKSRTTQVVETFGQIEGMSAVDEELLKINGNSAEFRASEDSAFLQGINNEIETGTFYHSTKTTPEKFMGLAPRLDATTNPYGSQIIKHDTANGLTAASGSDQTSLWLIRWGLDSVYFGYPKGSSQGLTAEDKGSQLWTDSGGSNKFWAKLTKWNWKLGLVVRDYRAIVRVCNIDDTNLLGTGTALVDSAIRAYHQIPPALRNSGRFAFYGNRKVGTYLHLQAKNATVNSTLTIDNSAGHPVANILGIPFRETDAIVSTESTVA
jgi:hypothetical protein